MTGSEAALRRASPPTHFDVVWVAGLLVVALALGLILRTVVEGQTREVTGAGLVLKIPTAWGAEETLDGLMIVDRLGSNSEILLRREGGSTDPETAALQRDRRYAQSLTLYRLTGQGNRLVGDAPGYELSYTSLDPLPQPPVVLGGIDVFWVVEGELISASLRAPVGELEEAVEAFEAILPLVGLEESS